MLVDPDRLADYDLPLDAVEAALRRASRNTSAGFRLAGGQEYLIRGAGRVRDVEGIGATVIAARDTRPIRVRDVGDVRVGAALKRGEGSHNGRPAVILGVHRQPGVNTLALTRALDAEIGRLRAELPPGMQLYTGLFRQADFIERALANLNAALRDGTLLVMAVTLVFLANLRAGAITLAAIPLSLLAAVAGLRAAGLSIDSMTLGGMAIAVGALVDDAIVDIENVARRLRENAGRPAAARRPALEVVYRASREVRGRWLRRLWSSWPASCRSCSRGRRTAAAAAARRSLPPGAGRVAGRRPDRHARALRVPAPRRAADTRGTRAGARGGAEARVPARAAGRAAASETGGRRGRAPAARRARRRPADGTGLPAGLQRRGAGGQRGDAARRQPGQPVVEPRVAPRAARRPPDKA